MSKRPRVRYGCRRGLKEFRIETKIDQILKKAGVFPKSGLIFRSFFLVAFVSFV
jgi:hypothetical protein